MKIRNKKILVITLLIIGLTLMVLPLIDNVKSISDIFKRQVLYNSLIETVIMIIGMLILFSLIILIFYTKIKENKSE